MTGPHMPVISEPAAFLALLAAAQFVFVPVSPCPRCLLSLPDDHTCQDGSS